MTEPERGVIVVSGASGLIGRHLVPALERAGRRVVKLVRGRAPATEPRAQVRGSRLRARRANGEPPRLTGPQLHEPEREYETERDWDPTAGRLELGGLGPVACIIHLAGENIGDGRWTSARKAAILGSRVDGTRTIVQAIARLGGPPPALVCASGIGYYGDRGDAEVDETAPPGDDFPAEVCSAWEAEAERARESGARVVRLRLGVVLARDGGALPKLVRPFKLGLGGKVGGGRQWFPWVTVDDAVLAFTWAVASHSRQGAFNVVAPQLVTQREFAKTLGSVLRRPSFMPLPGFMVKTLFGEMGETLLLGGQRAVPRRLMEAGFVFGQPALEPALRMVLER